MPSDPAEFAVAAEQAASSGAASVVSAHTPGQIISVVTVETADRSSAVASPWRSCPKRSGVRPRHPAAERTVVADLMRRLVEPGVPVVLGAARPAPQRHMAHAPAVSRRLRVLVRRCTAATRFSAAYREQANARTDSARACWRTVVQASDDHALSCGFQSAEVPALATREKQQVPSDSRICGRGLLVELPARLASTSAAPATMTR